MLEHCWCFGVRIHVITRKFLLRLTHQNAVRVILCLRPRNDRHQHFQPNATHVHTHTCTYTCTCALTPPPTHHAKLRGALTDINKDAGKMSDKRTDLITQGERVGVSG